MAANKCACLGSLLSPASHSGGEINARESRPGPKGVVVYRPNWRSAKQEQSCQPYLDACKTWTHARTSLSVKAARPSFHDLLKTTPERRCKTDKERLRTLVKRVFRGPRAMLTEPEHRLVGRATGPVSADRLLNTFSLLT